MNLRLVLYLFASLFLLSCAEQKALEPSEYIAKFPSKIHQGFGYFFQNRTYTIGNSLILNEDGIGVMVSCGTA